MQSWKRTRARRYTRRRTLGAGARLGMGLITTRQAPTTALAQATPPASLGTTSGYARPEIVIDSPSLMTQRDIPALAMIALMPAEEFARGHIPGSVQIDWPALETLDTSDAAITAWREDMARLLAALGISRERPVVTYDGETLFATRPWWLLHYLGHPDARVLNGGLAAWEAAGGEITTGPAPAASPAAATDRYEATPRPETLAPFAEVLASLENPDVVLVDARTPEEYAGGHIPGAVNINFPRNAVDEEPRVFKSQDALRALYEDAGVATDKRVIPYCSTGVRSSVTYFALRLIGYDDVALYTGSWDEWSRHPEAPIATGSEP